MRTLPMGLHQQGSGIQEMEMHFYMTLGPLNVSRENWAQKVCKNWLKAHVLCALSKVDRVLKLCRKVQNIPKKVVGGG